MLFYLQVLYKNTTYQRPYLLEIPKCESICPLQNFIDIIDPFIPKNWEKECSLESNNGEENWWPFNPGIYSEYHTCTVRAIGIQTAKTPNSLLQYEIYHEM